MLQETVEVWSRETKQKISTSLLVVGVHGQPVLMNAVPPTEIHNFPAVWYLHAPRNTWPGVLLEAWNEVEQIRQRIAIAEREAEARAAEEVDSQRGEADA